MASVFAVILIMLFYPAITLVEKIPAFDTFINQRKNGENKKQYDFGTIYDGAEYLHLLGEY